MSTILGLMYTYYTVFEFLIFLLDSFAFCFGSVLVFASEFFSSLDLNIEIVFIAFSGE